MTTKPRLTPGSWSTPVRLGAFAAVLAVAFGAAFGAGRLTGPDAAAETTTAGHPGGAGHDSTGPEDTGHEDTGHESGAQAGGFGFVAAPYTGGSLTFRITGGDGRVVTAFDTVHDRPLHLVVVRRDLSGFQHVHPERDTGGVWRVPLRLPDAGPWQVYADFTATGGPATVLSAGLPAPGAPVQVPLPAPATTAVVAGYTVRLDTHDGVTLRVERDGRPVTDLQPYLGAAGHLVAIAQGDLAYLHVHPKDPTTAAPTTGPEVRFAVEGAAAGTHRLYFQFRHLDVVHTAEFTVTGIGGGHAHN